MPVKYNITTEFCRLSYSVYGSNVEDTIVFFHGFGQDEPAYAALITFWAKKHRVLVVDLFFHGNSTWDSKTPLQVQQWQAMLAQICEMEHLQRFRLVGFSMGARFAMLSAISRPKMVRQLILIAPDGITMNPYYKLAISTALTRKLFALVVKGESRVLKSSVGALTRMKLLDRKVERFSLSQLGTQQQRDRVYNTWVYLRNIQVDLKSFAECMNREKIPVYFFIGMYDKIISKAHVEPLRCRLQYNKIYQVPAGHSKLLDALVNIPEIDLSIV